MRALRNLVATSTILYFKTQSNILKYYSIQENTILYIYIHTILKYTIVYQNMLFKILEHARIMPWQVMRLVVLVVHMPRVCTGSKDLRSEATSARR